jgi:hypothetical protein
MEADGGWTSPSELADYAYCPRSCWYRRHPPAGGASVASADRRRAGERYHRVVLGAERRRAERGPAYWAAAVLGLGLIVVGLVGLWVWGI